MPRRPAFRSFLLFSPVAVAFFAMLPRLLSPQFGLLDDGLTLIAVAHVSDNWTAAFTIAHGAGRFFSSYFLFLYLVHALVGVHSFLFFSVNYAVFAATTAVLIGFVRLMGGTPFQAWAAGIFFVVSGPAVESFYTLSKPAPPQLLWVVISLLIAAVGVRSRNRLARLAGLATTMGALLMADTTKETGIVTVAVAGCTWPGGGGTCWPACSPRQGSSRCARASGRGRSAPRGSRCSGSGGAFSR